MRLRPATFVEVMEFARTRVVVDADPEIAAIFDVDDSVVVAFSDGSIVAASSTFAGPADDLWITRPEFWIGEP